MVDFVKECILPNSGERATFGRVSKLYGTFETVQSRTCR